MLDIQTPLNLLWRRTLPISDPTTFRIRPGRFVKVNPDGTVSAIVDGILPTVMKQTIDYLPDNIYEAEDVRGGKCISVIEGGMMPPVIITDEILAMFDGDGNPIVYNHGDPLTIAYISGSGNQCLPDDIGKFIIAYPGDPVYGHLNDEFTLGDLIFFIIRLILSEPWPAKSSEAAIQITNAAPASNSSINNNHVSYTLSRKAVSGKVTFTRTSGVADPASPHVCALAGTELNAGAHSDIILTHAPTLVDSTVYSIKFEATDETGSVAEPVTKTGVSYNSIIPVFSVTAPATNADVNNVKVSYTLSKAIASGKITFARTGGAADPANPHVCNLAGVELNSGAHTNITLINAPTLVDQTIYSVTFEGTDDHGNVATPVVNTNITYDTTLPVFSSTAPASSALVNSAKVSYTLNKALASGKVTFTQTSGSADPSSPHVCNFVTAELAAGAHIDITLNNNPTLIDGAIYDVQFDGTDLFGNVAVPVIDSGVTYDSTLPVFTATAPATSAKVKNTKVSYTVDKALASGSVTFTRTNGNADPASPHVCALAGTELNSGAHSNITLTNAPTLVDGTVYTVEFNGVDLFGNSATPVDNTSVTYDITPVVISATGPSSSAIVSNAKVSFTLSEDCQSGSVTFTRTSGNADPASPHVCALAGSELNSGVHENIALTNAPTLVDGTLYSIAFNAKDTAGNDATQVVNTDITYDITAPTITSVAPITNGFVKDAKVSYTLSEGCASGSVTFTRTSGNADPASPHVCALAGTELDSGTHSNITLTNNPTLVDGTIYTVRFDATDMASNPAIPDIETGVTFDTTNPSISGTAPTSNAFVKTAKVSYTLSEDCGSGSVTFARTSGNADASSPHICALAGAELNSGAHSNITLTNNPTLVSGTVYSVTFNVSDKAGNAATSMANTGITFDNVAPVFSSVAPATNATVSDTKVSYTLSENIASGSITWTRTGGTADPTPHVQALAGAELNSGAHSAITLTNDPVLVNGTIYSVQWDGVDQAGNAATPVISTNVTYATSSAPDIGAYEYTP